MLMEAKVRWDGREYNDSEGALSSCWSLRNHGGEHPE